MTHRAQTRSLIPPQSSMMLADWRRARARALFISHAHRAYLVEFGRLPNCPLHLVEFAALEHYLQARESEVDPLSLADAWPSPPKRRLSNVYIAERIGMPSSSVLHMRSRGSLSRRTAERIADALGVYPGNIWPDYLFDVTVCDPELSRVA